MTHPIDRKHFIIKKAQVGQLRQIGKGLLKGLQKTVGSAAIAKGEGKGLRALMKDSPVLGLVGLGGALAAAGALEEHGIKPLVQGVAKQKHFNAAVNFDPEVSRWNNAEPEAVKARFNTLYRFNPSAAKDPLVASSWIKQTMEFPAVTPKVVTEIAEDRYKQQKGQTLALRLGEKALKAQFSTAVGSSSHD